MSIWSQKTTQLDLSKKKNKKTPNLEGGFCGKLLFQLKEIHGQCFSSARNFIFSLEKGKPGHRNISPEKCKFYGLVPANKSLLMKILFSSLFFAENFFCRKILPKLLSAPHITIFYLLSICCLDVPLCKYFCYVFFCRPTAYFQERE